MIMRINRRFLHEQLYQDMTKVLDKRILVLGCGAIGSNLVISLARRGFSRFILVDHDRIEEHNISTQTWTGYDLDRMKVHVLAGQIATIGAECSTHHKTVTKPKQINPFDSDIIVDTFDNSASRAVAQELGGAYSVLHVGMSGENTAEVTWAEHYTVPPDVELADPCAYPLSRTLIELTVVAASEAIMRFLLTGEKLEFFVNANRLSIDVV